MSSCLGLYIQNNVIKYAKVNKEHDDYKIEAYGIKFYDDIDEAVSQIVNETFSYNKVPISTNLSDEKYTYANLFSLLNQKDLIKAAKTEFEFFCNENQKNYNALDYKNIFIPNSEDKDKVITLYAYTEKSEITRKNQILRGYRVNNISPLPISITNLIQDTNKKNKAIVNIENKTSVTFMVNGEINKVEIIDAGMKEIFDNIIMKENSYNKAYEICKNTTIYTAQGKNLQIEENEYLEDIMPALYKVIEELKTVINNSGITVDEIYITGLAVAINNIDLYFQENFIDKKCEILAPFFVDKSNIKLNIRDYIEVNSAIALSLQGLGLGNKEINFKNVSKLQEFNEALNKEKNRPINKENKERKTIGLPKIDFKHSLDNLEKTLVRIAYGIFIIFVIYGIFSSILINQINKKDKEVNNFIEDSNTEIAKITENTKLVQARTEQYDTMIEKINEANNKLTESYARKNVLPNFLTEIMFNIPKEVQLVSITNTTGKSVTIQAKSKEYEQLGYFIAKIKNEAILTEVTATSGEKVGGFVVVTIQGNLPY